jgi:hypothetical protein
MKEKMGIVIDSNLKRELEEHNFKNRRTEFQINYSEVCRKALKSELELMRQASTKGTFKVKPFTDFEVESGGKSQNAREKQEKTVLGRQEGKKAICQNCGQEFTTKSTKSKYCSDKCNQAAYRDKKK